jgi:hypothetical protein
MRHTGLIWIALVAASVLAVAPAARGEVISFDFDTGTPALATGQNTPFDQTSGAVTAHFSSPAGAAFSVQNARTTSYALSQFSGNYLIPTTAGSVLHIKFSRPIGGITLTFATPDFHQVEVPATLQLTAYGNSTETPAVGTATAHGRYASDTMPQGTLSFNSGAPFTLVEIRVLPQPRAATNFLLDNIAITTTPAP